MEKKPLNQASLDVWYEMNQDEKNLEISEKILLLSGSHELSDVDLLEFNRLIELESVLLEKATLAVNNKNNISKKIYDFLKVLEGDERLHTLFSNIAISKFIEGDFLNPEDVDNTYHDLRMKDVDVTGHDELNGVYENIMENIRHIDEEIGNTGKREKCTVEGCIFCTEITSEEKQNALSSLHGDGYFNMDSTDALIELMVIIQRFERNNNGFDGDTENDDDDGFGF